MCLFRVVHRGSLMIVCRIEDWRCLCYIFCLLSHQEDSPLYNPFSKTAQSLIFIFFLLKKLVRSVHRRVLLLTAPDCPRSVRDTKPKKERKLGPSLRDLSTIFSFFLSTHHSYSFQTQLVEYDVRQKKRRPGCVRCNEETSSQTRPRFMSNLPREEAQM